MFRLFFGITLTLVGLSGAVDYYAYDMHDDSRAGWYVLLTAVVLGWGLASLLTAIVRRREWLD